MQDTSAECTIASITSILFSGLGFLQRNLRISLVVHCGTSVKHINLLCLVFRSLRTMTENTVIVFLFTILQGGQEATSIDPMSYPWTESSCLALNPPPRPLQKSNSATWSTRKRMARFTFRYAIIRLIYTLYPKELMCIQCISHGYQRFPLDQS